MMKLFRNPEIRRFLLLYGVITATASAAACTFGLRCGLLMLTVCAALLLLFLAATRRRYRRIAELAADIDRILHGEEHLSLDAYAEGELAVLQSEISKMTVRLREQRQNLQKDKTQLADSLADISHQLRTPLTSINLLVSLLSEPDVPADRRQKYARELYTLLDRIDWLITSLLKLSRLDAGTVRFQTERLPLAELLQRAAGPLLIPLELRGVRLSIVAEGTFAGDAAWTCEALTNILKNCMEHTPEGGTVTARASDNALFTEILLSDDGSGIALEDLPHIFERFYKGKDAGGKGFGIGLALARRIITAQNGTIKAENLTPSGARFTVRFYKRTV